MEMALILFNRLSVLFIIIAIGFIGVKTKLLKTEDIRGLSMVTLYIVGPFAAINGFKVECTPDVLGGVALAAAFATLAHVIFLLCTRLLEKPLKLTVVERASVMYSNVGMLSIPLVTMMLGSEWVLYTCVYNLVQLIWIWTHLYLMMSGEKRLNAKKFFLNPNVIAIIIGIFVLFFGLRFPKPVDSAMEMIAAMVGPMGMFISGMSIGGMSFKHIFSYKREWLVVFLRLLAMPVIMVLIAHCGLTGLVKDGQTILMICMLAAAGPAGSTVLQMSQLYLDRETADYAGAINVVTMLLCAVTMPLIIFFYYL